MVIVGLLALVIFGPSKLPRIARDLGRFAGKARASIEEFKSKLASEELREDPQKRRRKGRGPELRGPEAGGRPRYEPGTETDRVAEEPGEVRGKDRESAEGKELEEDRHQEPAATGLS